jgi:hypothetical protein
MAGLDPAIHLFGMDPRVKPAGDEKNVRKETVSSKTHRGLVLRLLVMARLDPAIHPGR